MVWITQTLHKKRIHHKQKGNKKAYWSVKYSLYHRRRKFKIKRAEYQKTKSTDYKWNKHTFLCEDKLIRKMIQLSKKWTIRHNKLIGEIIAKKFNE